MTDEERANQPMTKADYDFLDRRINHLSERVDVRYSDHSVRIENLENVRISFFIGIMALLFLNLGGVGLVIYLQTLPR